MRRLPIALLLVATAFVSGCRDDHVTIAYHPAPGSTFTYVIHVESPTSAPADLVAHQRILEQRGDTTRVEVTLEREGIGSRTFVMRFDRAAQLTAVESVEGIPADALGSLGLSEIFPAAAGAPPDRPLRPGDRWTIDDQVQLAGMTSPAQLTGVGHLVRLGVVDGHDTATVESETTLPLTATSATDSGVQTLRGTQTTSITVVYDLSTGSVRHSTASTIGRYDVEFGPPAGQAGAPINRPLVVEVRSEIRRTD